VLQRIHRFTADLTRTSHPQVREVSDYPDSADLLATADLLVTDYSSSMFDFTATGRPIVLHVPDYEHYRDSLRGFYFPLDEVAPGPLTRSHEELAVAVKERLGTGATPDPGYAAFRERFAPWDDGHAAERVVDEVFS
jgi:CDP-glycerol glycerophosphotransferase